MNVKKPSGLNSSNISLDKAKKFSSGSDSRPDISLEKKSLATASKTVNQPRGFES